jgi:glycosyltransferase involved in cell wall biosynthesis
LLELCLFSNGSRPYDSIVAPSQCTRDVILSYFADLSSATAGRCAYQGRVDVIPYGLDPEELTPIDRAEAKRALGLPGDAVVLLSTARISRSSKMNYDRLVFFFASLISRTTTKLLLVIAGSEDGPESLGVNALARERGISDRVRFLTNFPANEKSRIFSSADIFISLSDNLQESFGITLTEAMAAGLPVLCTDWDGYRDIVDDGVTGFRIPVEWKARNHPEDVLAVFDHPYDHSLLFRLSQDVTVDADLLLARALTLVENEKLRREMGEKGRARLMTEFAMKRVVARFDDLWRELREIANHDPHVYHDLAPVLRYDYPRHFRSYPTATNEVRIVNSSPFSLKDAGSSSRRLAMTRG